MISLEQVDPLHWTPLVIAEPVIAVRNQQGIPVTYAIYGVVASRNWARCGAVLWSRACRLDSADHRHEYQQSDEYTSTDSFHDSPP